MGSEKEMYEEIKRLAKSASNCMHTLLALRKSEQDDRRAIAAMSTVFGHAAPNHMDPFMTQNEYIASQKRSVSSQRAFVRDLVKPTVLDRVAQVDSDCRLTCDGGHQPMLSDRDCVTARQVQSMRAQWLIPTFGIEDKTVID